MPTEKTTRRGLLCLAPAALIAARSAPAAVAAEEREIDRLIADLSARLIGRGETPLAGKLDLALTLVQNLRDLLDIEEPDREYPFRPCPESVRLTVLEDRLERRLEELDGRPVED